MALKNDNLIYDWNVHGDTEFHPSVPIQFDDETLRDGLQCPSVTDPPIADKIEILHLMDNVGIDTAALGLPGAGPRAVSDVTRLAREIAESNLRIGANCAARTLEADIRPIAEISQKVGFAIEACTFIGSSPIRQFAEGWDLEFLLRQTEKAVKFAVSESLPVMFVTEDTVRAKPEDLRELYTTAIQAGASRICVCDTVGHVTPTGVRNLLTFIRQIVADTNPEVGIDWHGHRDRGLALWNTLTAVEAGATRIHGCALGVGERVGNTAMDLILANCKLLGWIDNDLSDLKKYCQKISEALKIPIPNHYPIMGEDAFRTGTGVHAAAIIKAEQKGKDWLADSVYSGVPAAWFGGQQIIEIGPMSGESNIIYWLKKRGFEPNQKLVKAIFDRAKASDKNLTDADIEELIQQN